jgi:hypothetical protein
MKTEIQELSKKTKTVKAVRATIKIGDIELDCYQMPDREYRMSKTQICQVVNLNPKRLSEIFELKHLQALLPQGFQLSEVSIKSTVEGSKGKADLLPLSYAALLWSEVPEGKALTQSCVIETLERRADQAFGIKRSEEERNDRLAQRVIHADGWRKLFTDWQKLDGCLKGWEYANRVNQLKVAANLPIDCIEKYDARQVQIMNNAEVIYDAMRRSGMSHRSALKMV